MKKKKKRKRKVSMMALACLIAMNGIGIVTGFVTGINGQRPILGSRTKMSNVMRLSEMLDDSVFGQPYRGKGEEGKMLARTIESGARIVSGAMDTVEILSEHEDRTVANSDDKDLRHGSRECLDTRIDFGGAIDNKAGKDEVNVHVIKRSALQLTALLYSVLGCSAGPRGPSPHGMCLSTDLLKLVLQ